jgi:hypothetical protein
MPFPALEHCCQRLSVTESHNRLSNCRAHMSCHIYTMLLEPASWRENSDVFGWKWNGLTMVDDPMVLLQETFTWLNA